MSNEERIKNNMRQYIGLFKSILVGEFDITDEQAEELITKLTDEIREKVKDNISPVKYFYVTEDGDILSEEVDSKNLNARQYLRMRKGNMFLSYDDALKSLSDIKF